LAHQYDVHITAYASLFRIVNEFHQEVFSDPRMPNGLNHSIDLRAVTLEYDRLLTSYRQEWVELFERDSDHTGAQDLPLTHVSHTYLITRSRIDAACEFRVKNLSL
jgi:hypothetical protein